MAHHGARFDVFLNHQPLREWLFRLDVWTFLAFQVNHKILYTYIYPPFSLPRSSHTTNNWLDYHCFFQISFNRKDGHIKSKQDIIAALISSYLWCTWTLYAHLPDEWSCVSTTKGSRTHRVSYSIRHTFLLVYFYTYLPALLPQKK